MAFPSVPSGYDRTKHVRAGRPDCLLTVGFDKQSKHIPRFLVQLHYQVATEPLQWATIARMDHNERSSLGHDIYREGLHVDIQRRRGETVHLDVRHGSVPQSRGAVIRGCVEYLREQASYFIDVYEGHRSPGSPPSWSPDGGDRLDTLMSPKPISGTMSEESPIENATSLEGLTEALAAVEGTTVEAIESGSEELVIEPPERGTVVED